MANDAARTARIVSAGRRPTAAGERLVLALLARMPRAVRDSFGERQIAALRHAAREVGWGRHPLDLRLRLPWLSGRRLYLTLIGGVDRRGRG